MAINIKFTAQEIEVINSLKKQGEATARLVEQNIKLAQSFARSDAQAKFFSKGIDRQRKELALFKKDVSDVAATMLGLQSGPLGGLGGAVAGGKGLAVGVSLDSLIAAGKAISDVTERYNRLQIALDAATGSQQGGARAFEFIKELAGQTGQRIETLATSYKTLAANAKGTKLEGAGVERIFAAITKAGSGMQLSNEQIKGSLKAVGDMMNKGKIQAEELTQQFSENFPGGAKIFADALGISTAELFKLGEQGKLLANDVLPKVAEYLEKTSKGEYAKNLNTITGSMNNLRNEVDLILVSFGNSTQINTFFSSINNGLADTLKGVRGIVTSGDWKSFMDVFLGLGIGNASLVGAGLAKGTVSTTKSEIEKFRELSREKQLQFTKVQKAIVESTATQFSLDLGGKFKYDPEGANKAANDLAKQGKILTDMLGSIKPIEKPSKVVRDPKDIAKEESAFAKQIRKENAEIKDEFDERRAILKAASLDAQFLLNNPSSLNRTGIADVPKAYGKGLADIQTGFGIDILSSAIQREKWEKMLPDMEYMARALQSRLTSFQKVINEQTGEIEWTVSVDPDKVKKSLGLYKSQAEDINREVSEINNMLAQSMGEGIGSALSILDGAISDFLSPEGAMRPLKEYLSDYINSLGDMMVKLGAQMVTQGAILAAFGPATGGATAIPANQQLIAGGALFATGQIYKAIKFAQGGIVSGPTYSMTGEYPGARNNPEVIAPLSKLGNLFTPYFQKAVNLGRYSSPQMAMQPINTTTNVYFDNQLLLRQVDRALVKKNRIG